MTKPFDPTKPVQTRDGRAARILATDFKGNYPIIAAISQENREYIDLYETSGKVSFFDGGGSDLVNIPEVTHKYINVYDPASVFQTAEDEEGNPVFSLAYLSANPDGRHINPNAIGHLKLTYEDGELISVESYTPE